MKKNFTILIFIIVGVLSFSLSGCFIKSDFECAVDYLKSALDIEVPNNSKILYWYQDDNFQGVHETYIVFEFTTNVDEWLNNYGFISSQDESENSLEEKENFEENFNHWLERSRKMSTVETELFPNFEKEYYWLLQHHKSNGMTKYVDYLLFYPDTNIFMCYRPFL